jgi:hypothetical protein
LEKNRAEIAAERALAQRWPLQRPPGGFRRSYFNYAVISAVISLFLLSEVFGSVAIVLGAHTWKMEQENQP